MSESRLNINELSIKSRLDLSKMLACYNTDNDLTDIGHHGDAVHIGYNDKHDNIWLYSDEYGYSAMMNGDKLDTYYNCWGCGHEGLTSDAIHEPEDEECKEFLEPFLAELKKEKLKELLK